MKRLFTWIFALFLALPVVFAETMNPFKPIYGILRSVFELGSLSWLDNEYKGYAVKFIFFIVIFVFIESQDFIKKAISDKKARSVIALAVAAISIIFMPDNVSLVAGNMYGTLASLVLLGAIPGVILWQMFLKVRKWNDSKSKYWVLSLLCLCAFFIFSAIGGYVGVQSLQQTDTLGIASIYSMLISVLLIGFVWFLVMGFISLKSNAASGGRIPGGVLSGLKSVWDGGVNGAKWGWNKSGDIKDAISSLRSAEKKIKKAAQKSSQHKIKYCNKILVILPSLNNILNTLATGNLEKKPVNDDLNQIFKKIAKIKKDVVKSLKEYNISIDNLNAMKMANLVTDEQWGEHVSRDIVAEKTAIQKINAEFNAIVDGIKIMIDKSEKSDYDNLKSVSAGLLKNSNALFNDITEYLKLEKDEENIYKGFEAEIEKEEDVLKKEEKEVESEEKEVKAESKEIKKEIDNAKSDLNDILKDLGEEEKDVDEISDVVDETTVTLEEVEHLEEPEKNISDEKEKKVLDARLTSAFGSVKGNITQIYNAYKDLLNLIGEEKRDFKKDSAEIERLYGHVKSAFEELANKYGSEDDQKNKLKEIFDGFTSVKTEKDNLLTSYYQKYTVLKNLLENITVIYDELRVMLDKAESHTLTQEFINDLKTKKDAYKTKKDEFEKLAAETETEVKELKQQLEAAKNLYKKVDALVG